jgi:hypothetical protein
VDVPAELITIITDAQRQGWRVDLQGDTLYLYAPREAGVVVIDGMPADRRALDDVVERMGRYGFHPRG